MRAIILLLVIGLFASADGRDADADVRKVYEAGEKAVQEGNLAGAEKCFLQVLELVPRDVGARINLGVVYMREKKWPKALAYLSEAEKLAPKVAGIRLNIGLVHYRQGDYPAAVPEFEAALKQQPDSAQARRLLGLCYLFEARYGEASAELEPLWPKANDDLSYLYSLAVAAGNGNDHELEQKALTRLMEVGKDSALTHLLLGKAYLAHGDDEHALAELEAAAAVDTKLPMLHYNLGIVYRHKGDMEKAQAEFRQDAALEPEVAFNYDQLGLLASAEGKGKEAEADFLEAVRRDRRLGTSWFGLAKISKDEKRYAEALKALDKAAEIDPKSASVHYLRAQVLTALGRKQEAAAELATVQSLKKETVDRLEQQVSGSAYHDPEMPAQ